LLNDKIKELDKDKSVYSDYDENLEEDVDERDN